MTLAVFSNQEKMFSFLVFALNPYPCASPFWIDDIQIWLIWIDFSSFTEFLWIVYFNHTLQKSNPPPQYLSETPKTLHFRTTLVTQALTYQEGILEETKWIKWIQLSLILKFRNCLNQSGWPWYWLVITLKGCNHPEKCFSKYLS